MANLVPSSVYDEMPLGLRDEIRGIADRIKARSAQAYFETGRDLLEAKARLEHGVFLKWVAREAMISPRTAQHCMAAVEALGDKSEKFSYLPTTALSALAAKSTPPAVRDTVLKRIESGEPPDRLAVLDEIKKAKAAAQSVKIEAKRTPAQRRYQAKVDAKREAEEAARRATKELDSAARAVAFLQQRLGDEFELFREIWRATTPYRFDAALRAR